MVRTRTSTRPSNPTANVPLLRFLKSNLFIKHCELAYSSGRHAAALAEMWTLLEILRKREQIPAQYRNHALKGEWVGWNDCHTEGDFVVVWKYGVVDGVDAVILAACGTHAHLFG
ncbi:type II toxin-antitoxin system YafQ family toxin [Stenotrophomonas sp. PSU_St103]